MTAVAVTHPFFHTHVHTRYQKLEADYRNRDTKWSPEEELELLRAFQVFGNRWPLVRIFYFPHRKLSQLKLK